MLLYALCSCYCFFHEAKSNTAMLLNQNYLVKKHVRHPASLYFLLYLTVNLMHERETNNCYVGAQSVRTYTNRQSIQCSH